VQRKPYSSAVTWNYMTMHFTPPCILAAEVTVHYTMISVVLHFAIWRNCLPPTPLHSSPCVSESPVIIPDVPPPPISTTLLTFNPSQSSSTYSQPNVLFTALTNPTPWPNKSGINARRPDLSAHEM
jgi:hypothetical protein